MPDFNPLSQEGGCCNPPFPIFPRTIFAFLLRLPYGQFTHPLSRHPCIYEKKFSKIFAVEKVGGGEVATTPPPLLSMRGKGWQQKFKKFRNFHFLIFSLCHNNDYVPEILET